MRKIVFYEKIGDSVFSNVGSRMWKKHVFHTYFGDIDIDTMEVALYDFKDSLPCYLVKISSVDSVEKAPGVWGYIYGPLKYYYCPQKNTYYHTFPDNQDDSYHHCESGQEDMSPLTCALIAVASLIAFCFVWYKTKKW